jgi:tRNA threonylcarbamoyladenosine biosynthesis protein TsaE
VIHLDLYRLADPAELDYLGLVDLLRPGSLLLVEWPEQGGDRLPAGRPVRIALDYDGTARMRPLRCDGGGWAGACWRPSTGHARPHSNSKK